MNKSEIEICDFEMHLKNCFVSALSNDDKILRKGQVWKRVWKITFFGPKWGQDLLTERHTPPPPTKNSQEYTPGIYWALKQKRLQFSGILINNLISPPLAPDGQSAYIYVSDNIPSKWLIGI